MPITPFIGVRISWLTFERNSLRARPAVRRGGLRFGQLTLEFSDALVTKIAQKPPHARGRSHPRGAAGSSILRTGRGTMTADSSARQRLLIVEDDVHMAYLLGYLAEKERFDVETIADGRLAVERIDAGPAADLVLLDVMLPYLDGFELLDRLRRNPAWKQVPVIILTSRTREHDAVRALGLGADDYLTKPFSPAELVARIRRRLPKPAGS